MGAERLQHHHADGVHGERAGTSACWMWTPQPSLTLSVSWVCARGPGRCEVTLGEAAPP